MVGNHFERKTNARNALRLVYQHYTFVVDEMGYLLQIGII